MKRYETATFTELGAAEALVHGPDGIWEDNPEVGSRYGTNYDAATIVEVGAADEVVLGPSGFAPDNPEVGGEQLMAD